MIILHKYIKNCEYISDNNPIKPSLFYMFIGLFPIYTTNFDIFI